jgi:hypothetical protein
MFVHRRRSGVYGGVERRDATVRKGVAEKREFCGATGLNIEAERAAGRRVRERDGRGNVVVACACSLKL